ncbi:hypothetical protein LX15_002505 [Streptoalloteichus tenebrarius]|uniref:Uncharacterized protein n=1 Tax=Streptoalloteichus tenebrarius (strain ATCC 17920 / DSM 40477 / JCM 4838 / CBS 697.72 / NBRC 16177 / NCIMB 11028 / NRRL B-12390 / A12253. 1 / ISP 5477) TaxID=1933 RepID=A0ABT1HTH2_STRSD|nr:hypothetical protein [Streptoalloteichus tenebrarius]BFE99512.1 hypothetical protein GCM10020241_11880 [Streptoalloteichus tenebrarius]
MVGHAVIAEVLPLAGDLGLGMLAMRPFAEGKLLPGPAPEDPTGYAAWTEALLRWTLSTPQATAGAGRPLTRQQWDLVHRLAR